VQKYECVFILRADQPESEMQARVDRIAGILASHEGEITRQDRWGVRRLAYEIDDETKGDYMLLGFRGEGTAVAEIDKSLRLDDRVLRHLVVRDEEWEERNRVAMAKRRQKRSGDDNSSS
jgi:small subunit ribosomal protein S6